MPRSQKKEIKQPHVGRAWGENQRKTKGLTEEIL
jgi:hypothetical protein